MFDSGRVLVFSAARAEGVGRVLGTIFFLISCGPGRVLGTGPGNAPGRVLGTTDFYIDFL